MVAWGVAGFFIVVAMAGDSQRNANTDAVDAICLVGTWTLTQVVDEPATAPPRRMTGTSMLTFNADGTGGAQDVGIESDYILNGQIVSHTLDMSDSFRWANHESVLSFPADQPKLTARDLPSNEAVIVMKRQPEIFRCYGDSLMLMDSVRDIQSVTHQVSATYQRR
jgi:hypothetical protein